MKFLFTGISVLLLAFFCSTPIFSQNVAINTSGAVANSSAMLDISSTNSGLLIPRVALSATNVAAPIAAPATSLMVYNTATASAGATAVSPGYYYWDGTQWLRLINQGNDWLTTGNYGTSAATNYLGTNDAVDLVIRTNGTEKMRVTSAGNVGVGDASPSALFTVCNGDLFQVVNTGHTRTINGSNANPAFSFTGDPDCGLYHSALVDDIGLATGGTTRLWISDAGEVYVGATAPVLPGDLFSATASNINAVTSGSGNLTWAINGYTNYNGGSVYGLRLGASTGNWGAGQFELSVGNPANSRGVSGAAGSNTQYGSYGSKPAGGAGWGGLFLNDLGYTGFFGAASDRRLKTNINPLNNALNLITQIPLYSYQYKTDQYTILGDESVHYGVMADELKLIFPSLVKSKTLVAGDVRNPSGDGQLKGVEGEVELVNYLELVPISLQAIKELNTEVETLKLQNKELEDRLKRLEEAYLLLQSK